MRHRDGAEVRWGIGLLPRHTLPAALGLAYYILLFAILRYTEALRAESNARRARMGDMSSDADDAFIDDFLMMPRWIWRQGMLPCIGRYGFSSSFHSGFPRISPRACRLYDGIFTGQVASPRWLISWWFPDLILFVVWKMVTHRMPFWHCHAYQIHIREIDSISFTFIYRDLFKGRRFSPWERAYDFYSIHYHASHAI